MIKKWITLKAVESIKELNESAIRERLYGLLKADPSNGLDQFIEELQSQNFFIRERIFSRISLLEKDLNFRDQTVWFVNYGEPLYPKYFYQMMDPPLALSILGQDVWNKNPILSVVGSREPSAMTVQWMENHLSQFVQKQKVSLVSGGARGVDQLAHFISIREGQPTLVILPSGLNEIYPSNLAHRKKDIIESGGCFMSEYLPSQKMFKHLFHHRNRLIAGVSPMVLVAEAWMKSGSVMTGHHALMNGRTVGVVPGHPDHSHFGGSLFLLSETANLIRNAEDLTLHLQSSIL